MRGVQLADLVGTDSSSKSPNEQSSTVPAELTAQPAFEQRERLYWSPQRIKDVALVPVTDREFWMRVQGSRYERGTGMRCEPPKRSEDLPENAKLGRFSEQMEEGVRRWLGTQLPLSDARGVLYSRLNRFEREYRQRCYEIDAVSLTGGVPDILFEIKVGFRGELRNAAVRQLQGPAAVVAYLHPHIRCAVIMVNCNPNAEHNSADLRVGSDLRLDVPELYNRVRANEIPCITVEIEPMLEYAAQMGVLPRADLIASMRANQERRLLNRNGRARHERDGI